MAICWKTQVAWVPFTNVTTPRNQVTLLVPDTATPLNSCQYITVNASEYSQLSHGYIDNPADAQLILGAFVVLFAIVFGFRQIARAMNVGDSYTDEKH